MTSIDRARFVTDLTSRNLPARDVAASLPEVAAIEIDSMAGDDRVFNRPEEVGALYDRLVALETADRSAGRTGDLDRARAVYARFTASASTMTNWPPAPMVDPSARPRTTGIAAPPPLVSDADYVRAYGRMHAAQLRSEAGRDEHHPAARAARRVLANTDRAADEIAAITNPVERREAVNRFENYIASERAGVWTATARPRDPLRALPPYIRESIAREGVVIPGMPGALQPSYSPRGFGWGIKW